jgi:hypothetical protein
MSNRCGRQESENKSKTYDLSICHDRELSERKEVYLWRAVKPLIDGPLRAVT